MNPHQRMAFGRELEAIQKAQKAAEGPSKPAMTLVGRGHDYQPHSAHCGPRTRLNIARGSRAGMRCGLMNMTDLHSEVLATPGACLLLVARARLSAEKHGRPLDSMINDYLSQTAKLRGALYEARGLSLRKVLDVIEDERFDFYRRARKRPKRKPPPPRCCAILPGR